MTPAQYLLLAVIVDDGPQRQTDLSKRLRITPASVSQLVARMESNGHIERTADGRANIVDLTAAGRTLFATIEPSHRAHIAHQFEPLSDNQLGQLVSLLDKL